MPTSSTTNKKDRRIKLAEVIEEERQERAKRLLDGW